MSEPHPYVTEQFSPPGHHGLQSEVPEVNESVPNHLQQEL